QPCRHDERYDQFDFWIGQWDVFNPQGQLVGTSRVEKLLDDCLILEHWTDSFGNSGKSMNYYDAAADLWTQVWVDGFGRHTHYQGRFKDGALPFLAQTQGAAGKPQHLRMTFTPATDGKVRQH